jgi:hypothetical protein
MAADKALRELNELAANPNNRCIKFESVVDTCSQSPFYYSIPQPSCVCGKPFTVTVFQYWVKGKGWLNYNGQVSYPNYGYKRPLAVCDSYFKSKWRSEIESILVNNYKMPRNGLGTYIQERTGTVNGQDYVCDGGVVFARPSRVPACN